MRDPKDRIDYLKKFLARVAPQMKGKMYLEWCSTIRTDIGEIQLDNVREDAKKLFERVVAAERFLVEFPSELDKWVKPKIQDLITYLETHDK